MSSTQISCVSPASSQPNLVLLSVATENGMYSSGRELFFQFSPRAVVVALFPGSGPTVGGTIVDVIGKDLDVIPTQACVFGSSLQVSATLVSTSLIRCRTPAHAAGGVAVSVGSSHLSLSAGDVSFHYLSDFQVHSVSPTVFPRKVDRKL